MNNICTNIYLYIYFLYAQNGQLNKTIQDPISLQNWSLTQYWSAGSLNLGTKKKIELEPPGSG